MSKPIRYLTMANFLSKFFNCTTLAILLLTGCSKISTELVSPSLGINLGPNVPDPGSPANNLNLCTKLLLGNTYNQRITSDVEELHGVVTHEIRDHQDGKTTNDHYLLLDDGSFFKVDLAKLPKDASFSLNKRVSVKVSKSAAAARQTMGTIELLDIKQVELDENVSTAKVLNGNDVRKYSFLTVLVSFNNVNTKQFVTKSKLQQKMNEVKQHFELTSQGKTLIELDADQDGEIDYITHDLPINFVKGGSSQHCTNAYYRQQVINNLPKELTRRYTNFAVVVQEDPLSTLQPLCGFSVANLPGRDTLMTFMLSDNLVTIHEIGHNFNLWHAQADLNGNKVGSDQGEEYGDISCMMGRANFPPMLGATSSMVMGYYQGKESRIKELTQGGAYSLTPLADLNNDLHPKILRFAISAEANQFINIVYRARVGVDQNIIANPPAGYFPDYTGINIHWENYRLTNAGNVAQQGLMLKNLNEVGEQFTFTHPQNGRVVTVTLTNKSLSKADISLTMNFTPPASCLKGHAEPRVNQVYVLDKRRAKINYQLINTNSYSCPVESFNASVSGDLSDIDNVNSLIPSKGIANHEMTIELPGSQEFAVGETYQSELLAQGSQGTKSQAFKFEVINCP